jgi:hypothetical protein
MYAASATFAAASASSSDANTGADVGSGTGIAGVPFGEHPLSMNARGSAMGRILMARRYRQRPHTRAIHPQANTLAEQ